MDSLTRRDIKLVGAAKRESRAMPTEVIPVDTGRLKYHA
jgi:hypothetical protein